MAQEQKKKMNDSTVNTQGYADILGQINETEAKYLEAYTRWKNRNDELKKNNVNQPLIDKCFAEILNIGTNNIGRYGLNPYNVSVLLGYSVVLMSQGGDLKKMLSAKVADTFERPVERLKQQMRLKAESDDQNLESLDINSKEGQQAKMTAQKSRSRYEYFNRLHEKILNYSSTTSFTHTPKSAAIELTANEMHYFDAIREPNLTPADMQRLKAENEQRRDALYESLGESGIDLDELQKEVIKVQRNLIMQRPERAHCFQMFDYDEESGTLQFHEMDTEFVGKTMINKYYKYYKLDESGNEVEVIHPDKTDGLIEREINPILDDGSTDSTATVKQVSSNTYTVTDDMMLDKNGYIDKNLIHWARPCYSESEYETIFTAFLSENYEKLNDKNEDVTVVAGRFQYLIDCALVDGIPEDRVHEKLDAIIQAMGGSESGFEYESAESEEDVNVGFDEFYESEFDFESEYSDFEDSTPETPEQNNETNIKTPDVIEVPQVLNQTINEYQFSRHISSDGSYRFDGTLARFEAVSDIPKLKTSNAKFQKFTKAYDELCYMRGYYPYDERKTDTVYEDSDRQNNVKQIQLCMVSDSAICSEIDQVLKDTDVWQKEVEKMTNQSGTSVMLLATAREIKQQYGTHSDFRAQYQFLKTDVLPKEPDYNARIMIADMNVEIATEKIEKPEVIKIASGRRKSGNAKQPQIQMNQQVENLKSAQDNQSDREL